MIKYLHPKTSPIRLKTSQATLLQYVLVCVFSFVSVAAVYSITQSAVLCVAAVVSEFLKVRFCTYAFSNNQTIGMRIACALAFAWLATISCMVTRDYVVALAGRFYAVGETPVKTVLDTEADTLKNTNNNAITETEMLKMPKNTHKNNVHKLKTIEAQILKDKITLQREQQAHELAMSYRKQQEASHIAKIELEKQILKSQEEEKKESESKKSRTATALSFALESLVILSSLFKRAERGTEKPGASTEEVSRNAIPPKADNVIPIRTAQKIPTIRELCKKHRCGTIKAQRIQQELRATQRV
jgi:hypothetical protein